MDGCQVDIKKEVLRILLSQILENGNGLEGIAFPGMEHGQKHLSIELSILSFLGDPLEPFEGLLLVSPNSNQKSQPPDTPGKGGFGKFIAGDADLSIDKTGVEFQNLLVDAIGLSAITEGSRPAFGNDNGLGRQVLIGKTLEIECQSVLRIGFQKFLAQSQKVVVSLSEASGFLSDVLVSPALGEGSGACIIVQSQIGGGKQKLIPGAMDNIPYPTGLFGFSSMSCLKIF